MILKENKNVNDYQLSYDLSYDVIKSEYLFEMFFKLNLN